MPSRCRGRLWVALIWPHNRAEPRQHGASWLTHSPRLRCDCQLNSIESYKWNSRTPTAREQRRGRLDEAISATFTASGGTYGFPRLTRELHEEGWRVSENTVAARMAELGPVTRVRRKPRSLTRQGKRAAAPDLVRRTFTAVAPDVLWCGDVTEILTEEGKLYLATVEDLVLPPDARLCHVRAPRRRRDDRLSVDGRGHPERERGRSDLPLRSRE